MAALADRVATSPEDDIAAITGFVDMLDAAGWTPSKRIVSKTGSQMMILRTAQSVLSASLNRLNLSRFS